MKSTQSLIFAIVCAAGLSLSTTAMAAGDKADPAAFQAHKEQQIANIQERLQIQQTYLTCVQAATDHAAMKACRDADKKSEQELSAKIKAQRPAKK